MRNFDKFYPDDSRRSQVQQYRSLWEAPPPPPDAEGEEE